MLYVEDLATVLGKSEKAVANLIARDGLPFNIKTIGRRRCASVHQVAQWLASDSDAVTEVRVWTNQSVKEAAAIGLAVSAG